MLTLYNKLSTTSQQNENMAAIGSRPTRAHHSSHVHASFLYGIELCCIRCKKCVQEKSCTRNHVRWSSFLYKSTCTSFLYKFLDCVSPP